MANTFTSTTVQVCYHTCIATTIAMCIVHTFDVAHTCLVCVSTLLCFFGTLLHTWLSDLPQYPKQTNHSFGICLLTAEKQIFGRIEVHLTNVGGVCGAPAPTPPLFPSWSQHKHANFSP
mmetsp:Transcript_113501/g.197126  ORF Transcript_113501/g.197126 Transcript_113501/m.197126 type:complete len:119 (-) Transcript_113501:473-829(-)